MNFLDLYNAPSHHHDHPIPRPNPHLPTAIVPLGNPWIVDRAYFGPTVMATQRPTSSFRILRVKQYRRRRLLINTAGQPATDDSGRMVRK
jgi:hypothetical protein